MKVVLPIADGKLCTHFDHCQAVSVFKVNLEDKKIINRTDRTPPAHEPVALPQWLSEFGANLIISEGYFF